MVLEMVKEHHIMKMEINFMKVNGLMINIMVKEQHIMKMEIKDMKVNC